MGESINPEAWMWYNEHIGGNRCPIVDTWWQTETGGQMISPLPGVTTLKPGSACFALPGIGVEVVDEEGHPIERGGGYLTLTRPWPAMLRGIWGAPERYKDTYWSRYPGRYFAGDGAKIDDDGYIWLLVRAIASRPPRLKAHLLTTPLWRKQLLWARLTTSPGKPLSVT